jgi:hypothetical protein
MPTHDINSFIFLGVGNSLLKLVQAFQIYTIHARTHSHTHISYRNLTRI